MVAKKQDKNYIFAVGRRKTSVARVRLYSGKEENVVNEQSIAGYFPGEIAKKFYLRPFQLAGAEGKYFATVKVKGGGKESQLDAVVHGISRALAQVEDCKFRPVLKNHGLLTRDPRARERRKVGTGGKARRKKQSPKR